MVSGNRQLPATESGGDRQLSRPRARWRNVILAIREDMNFRGFLGVRENNLLNFRRILMVRMESLVRRVVSEEVNNVLQDLNPIPRPIPNQPNRPRIQLKFLDKVNHPVHTAPFKVEREKTLIPSNFISNVKGDTGLRIAIFCNNEKITSGSLSSVEIEILVLHGDFCSDGREIWSIRDFDNNIVQCRDKKPPVLLQNRKFRLRNGEGCIDWLIFGDNSSWNKSKMFKLGIRAVNWNGERVQEGITEAFPVKDRRMEGNKKHHPPLSADPVWRLEGIARNGDRCKSLESHNISTVRDLLDLHYANEARLCEILGGISKSNKFYKTIIEHALECVNAGDYNGVLNNTYNQSEEVLTGPISLHSNPTNHQATHHGMLAIQQISSLGNEIIDPIRQFALLQEPCDAFHSQNGACCRPQPDPLDNQIIMTYQDPAVIGVSEEEALLGTISTCFSEISGSCSQNVGPTQYAPEIGPRYSPENYSMLISDEPRSTQPNLPNQVQIPAQIYETFTAQELSHDNSQLNPWRNNSLDSDSFGELIQSLLGPTANENLGPFTNTGPFSLRRKAKIKALLKWITRPAIARRKAGFKSTIQQRIVPAM